MTSQKQSDSKTQNQFLSVNGDPNEKKSSMQSVESEKDARFQTHTALIGQKLHVRLEKDELQEFFGLLHDLGFSDDTVARANINLAKHNCIAVYFHAKE